MAGRRSMGAVSVAVMRLATLLLVEPSSGQQPLSDVDALSEIRAFVAVPEQVSAAERPRRLEGRGVKATEPAYSVHQGEHGFVFRVQGQVPHVRAMRWRSSVAHRDLSSVRYYVLRYRARGLRREYKPFAVIALVGPDAAGKRTTVPLLDCSQVINDGRWHVVVGKAAFSAKGASIEVEVRTSDSLAWLEISRCSFHAARPDVPEAFAHGPAGHASQKAFRCIDLAPLFNDTYSAAIERTLKKHGMVVDGGWGFSEKRIQVGPVPFVVETSGKNIVVPARNAEANAGTVKVLGVELPKRLYYRVARDDRIVVPLGARASEVCFILVAEMPPTTRRYALPSIPTQLHDIDAFAVQLIYEEGEPDWAFPYSIADEGFTIQRVTAAYAVPTDPKRTLKAVAFCNRFEQADFNLAAVTLNTGPAVVIPPAVRSPKPYRVRVVAEPKPVKPTVKFEQGECVIANGHYMLRLDTRDGLAIRSLKHLWAPEAEVRLNPRSGIEVEVGEKLLTGKDFRTRIVSRTLDTVTFALESTDPLVPLRLRVTARADQSPQLCLQASVKNAGDEPIRAAIRFPMLEGLVIGDLADTWLYFPQYRNVLTNEPGTYFAANDRQFSVQFFDVFNPEAGVGIGLLTHRLDDRPIDYSLRKDAAGATAFVQYPAEYHKIDPGDEVELTETCLLFHSGDWHAALAAYRDWAQSWYKPVKAGRLDWWHKAFALRTHLTARAYPWAVPIFDNDTKTYRIKELLEEDKKYLGTEPDIVHLVGWCDYENRHGGDFLGGDYAVEDYTGGLETLRAAIGELQRRGIRVSVYSIPDRCAKSSRIGRQLGPQIARVLANGRPLQDEHCWYVCLGAKAWQDNYVKALKRTYRELKVDAIYVDVFGYTRGYACYSKRHGHEVPLNVNKICHTLIRRLRHELPEGVAIWSEFQLPDVSTQFTSGNITYYFLTLHEYLAKSYDQTGLAPQFILPGQNICRFAFPRLKQFGFPVGFRSGIESYGLRFLFFNGEGLYDVGWLLYDSRQLATVRRWLAIQKEYADCFRSSNPKPLVPTEAGHIYANEFPGEGRRLWTLFNGRFTTYEGPVLSVEHRPGATYRDLWHDRDLHPRIAGGRAVITLRLDPQGLGCVVQRLSPSELKPQHGR
ncbi:MAG: hypothetical protein GXP27_16835 [Planctomycetes bacterium]|nr:hypothetical protein [Planctomycetota bacterium]